MTTLECLDSFARREVFHTDMARVSRSLALVPHTWNNFFDFIFRVAPANMTSILL